MQFVDNPEADRCERQAGQEYEVHATEPDHASEYRVEGRPVPDEDHGHLAGLGNGPAQKGSQSPGYSVGGQGLGRPGHAGDTAIQDLDAQFKDEFSDDERKEEP